MAKPSATIDDALLDAGAVLPATATPAGDDTIDMLTARAYRHPALGDRTVVQLVPGKLGGAEDLTLEFLGFDPPERVIEVGLVRQQALGFPAWALVHDPANGHHALALVKDIERLTRMAKSRVGPAKDGFDALAEQLSRSVPHFLPTFYEEAARAFVTADSATYAASMFGKARDAERAYALAIDEERQHTVFLEFALAGALTAKALSAHARDLAARSAPDVAYERFRRLCVERTLGGLPPYAAMHVDLRRLATKAKIGAEADEQFLAELLAAPAVVRAPGSFWIAYRPVLARLARRDPAVRGRLLSMLPTECADDVWLDILEEAGAVAALTDPADTVPAAAASPDGPAGWLARFDERREGYRRKRLPALFTLVERMAARLRSDGVPVALCREHDYVDFDVVDLCLALGVPVADVSKQARYHVQQWLDDKTEGSRDLAHLAGNDRLRAGLAESIESYLQPGWNNKSTVDAEKVANVVAVPGLRAAVSWWLDRVADSVIDRGLPTLGQELDRVTLLACADGLAVNPAALARIVAHRLGPVLGRTLRAGVLDEYGWPAFESATAALGVAAGDDEGKLQYVGQWPQLVVRAGDQVVVVDGAGVAAEHLVRIPADQRSYMWRTALRYVDGQLLVSWDIGRERACYWSGSPDDVFIAPDDAFSFGNQYSLALPGGGRTAGGRPLRVGDRSAEEHGPIATDGTTHWVHTDQWYEYDVRTGVRGRPSMPSFFEDGGVDGSRLDRGSCMLLPAPDQPDASPLGSRDGLIGWRVRDTADGTRIGDGIDGRSFTLPAALRGKGGGLHGKLLGAFRFPGSDTTYGVMWTSGYRDNNVTLCTDDGFVIGRYTFGTKRGKFAKGTAVLPPAGYWHHLRPRDEAGSAALRALGDDVAEELLTAAAGLDLAGVTAVVGRLLPGVTDAALIQGVAGVVRQAAKHTARLAEFARVAAGGAVAAKEKKARVEPAEDGHLPKDSDLMAALSGFLPYCYDRGRSAARMLAQTGAVLAGGTGASATAADLAQTIGSADEDWFLALSALPAAMIRAASPVTQPEERTALIGLLEVCGASGLLAPGGRLRQLWLEPDGPGPVYTAGDLIPTGAGHTFVTYVDAADRDMKVLEYAPGGAFAAVPGFRITRELVFDPYGVTPATIAAFIPLIGERGPVPWRPEIVETASRTVGISRAEAATLLAGLPTQAAWDAWPERLPIHADAAKTALVTWESRSRTDRAGSLAALLPDDIVTLWTAGPDLARLAEWWASRHGTRTPVADELIVEARKAGIAEGMSASEMLHGLANAGTCRWLAGEVDGIDGIDGDDVLVTVVRALPWLVYRLPAGDPIRAGLRDVLDRVRDRLADPALVIDVGYLDEKKIAAFTTALGIPVVTDERGIDAGAVFFPPDSGWRKTQLRPSRLSGGDDSVLGMLSTRLDSAQEGPIAAIRVLLGGHLAEWVDHTVPPDADGGEHDPSRSVPALVAEIASARQITADAATVYLQLLALPDPTDRNIASWTGWKPARLKAARGELARTDLVVDAKRTRAGRTLFLPGGWLALRAPHLPLERWKLPLLVGGAGAIDGIGMVIPIAPVPRLFDLAWARVRQGDAPRFDDLVTGRQR